MINRDNLKIFKPEKLGNFDEAGGQRTRNAIDSGKLNELFSAISDIDHAQSAVDIAKCYPGLDTPGTDNLLDAHVFIGQPPTDPLVSTFLVESPLLDDADRLPDMKEIIESSLVAGSLQKKGMPGFLPYQNSFSRDYLYSTYVYNGREYRKTIALSLGQVIVIAVEYEGNEDLDWPRRQHFAQVTDTHNEHNEVEFSPAIDFATPASSEYINGEYSCTVMRFTNEADVLKYHGVTRLRQVATAENKTILVDNTTQYILPQLLMETMRSGFTLGDFPPSSTSIAIDKSSSTLMAVISHTDVTEQVSSSPVEYYYLLRETMTMEVTGGQTYHFETDRVLIGEYEQINYEIKVEYYSGNRLRKYGGDYYVQLSPTGFSVTLTRVPDSHAEIVATFVPNDYQEYSSISPLPSGKAIVRYTLAGTLLVESENEPVEIDENRDGIYVRVDGNLRRAALLVYETGEIIYTSTRYSGLSFTALIVEQRIFSDPDPLPDPEPILSTQFSLAVTVPKLDTFYVYVMTESIDSIRLSGSSNAAGVVTGEGVNGSIVNNLVSLTFSQGVILSSLRYDITEYLTQLPPPELYGLDPLRIPNAGLVDIFHVWNPIAISDKQEQVLNSVVVGQVFTVRSGADFVDITDTQGRSLWTSTDDHYSYDNALARVTINSDCSEFVFPLILADTLSELALVVEKTNTSLTVAKALSRDYPAGAVVSSVQVLGDLQARVTAVRDMTAWVNDWNEDGDSANANLNVVDYPIEVTNDTATNEEWVLIFTSSTSFRVLGRRLGQIATSDTLSDLAPINPLTNQPYFVIRQAAFGSGWNAGEAIRFGTIAAAKPVMPVRTVQVGHSQQDLDQTVLAFRGNEG